jgi:adenylate cyclase
MSKHKVNGVLIAVGRGDDIPLLRPKLTVGRRRSCDICLRFPNISGEHCEFTFRAGYWWVRDRGSTNGVKVNGSRIIEKMLRDTDEVSIGKRVYAIRYDMPRGGGEGEGAAVPDLPSPRTPCHAAAGRGKKQTNPR